jgi:hypothetical protein
MENRQFGSNTSSPFNSIQVFFVHLICKPLFFLHNLLVTMIGMLLQP